MPRQRQQQDVIVTVKAEARWVRSSARKARIVLDNIRGRTVPEARTILAAAYANEGPTLKRDRARARGRASQILKRTCHITILLGEDPKAEQRPRRRAAAPTRAETPAPETTEKPKPKRRSPAKKKEAVA